MKPLPAQDVEFLGKYRHGTIYFARDYAGEGGYVTILADSNAIEETFQVSPQIKVGVRLFYANNKSDFTKCDFFRLKKKAGKWVEDSSVRVGKIGLAHIKQYLEILSQIDFAGAQTGKIAIHNLKLEGLAALASGTESPEVLEAFASNPNLTADVFALSSKRQALKTFEEMLRGDYDEPAWQSLFEENKWIFGYGMTYKFLQSSSERLETTTTGASFLETGKRVDGLAQTRAEVGQYVFIEIKRSDTPLLSSKEYRGDCWAVSSECIGAIAQVQKTVSKFARDNFSVAEVDEQGDETGRKTYAVQPRSYIVIGNTESIKNNPKKIESFELFRRNITNPEIITFDELYYRAQFIVENLPSMSGVQDQ